jgi:hypothetical protein
VKERRGRFLGAIQRDLVEQCVARGHAYYRNQRLAAGGIVVGALAGLARSEAGKMPMQHLFVRMAPGEYFVGGGVALAEVATPGLLGTGIMAVPVAVNAFAVGGSAAVGYLTGSLIGPRALCEGDPYEF